MIHYMNQNLEGLSTYFITLLLKAKVYQIKYDTPSWLYIVFVIQDDWMHTL